MLNLGWMNGGYPKDNDTFLWSYEHHRENGGTLGMVP